MQIRPHILSKIAKLAIIIDQIICISLYVFCSPHIQRCGSRTIFEFAFRSSVSARFAQQRIQFNAHKRHLCGPGRMKHVFSISNFDFAGPFEGTFRERWESDFTCCPRLRNLPYLPKLMFKFGRVLLPSHPPLRQSYSYGQI
jgi:hypothetical protein